ncbi:MAG TPA: PASTA domain-containing protein, partial [Solirubrobacteraceae bacterium]|nr:PASTA domain-containing protein [Solirubrobacteraceae bacterium]
HEPAPASAAPDGTVREPGPPDGGEPPPPTVPPAPAAGDEQAPPAAPQTAPSLPAVPAPPGPTVPELPAVAAAPVATGDASLVITPADPAVGVAGLPAVEAGATLMFLATIRNESQIVDNYDLRVVGLPDDWAVVTPAAAFLVPLGSGRGESDEALRIEISPPRTYRSTAGIWTFELLAFSRTTAQIAARAVAEFELKPFQAWSVEVVPLVKAGRLRARYRTAARNDGNGEQELWPIAIEDSGRIKTRFATGRLVLAPGEVGIDVLTVRPRIPLPVGRTIEHRIGVDVMPEAPQTGPAELTAKEKLAAKAKEQGATAAKGVKVGPKGVTLPKLPRLPRPQNLLKKVKLDPAAIARLRSSGDAAGPLTARQVAFRQKPIIPLWLIALIILLAIAGYVIYTLLPDKTHVPRLVGAGDTFVAEKRLRAAGLDLSQPTQRRTDPDHPPGSVIEQTPSAGTKVDKGDSVTIVVASGTTKVEVPRLTGLTRGKADERLRAVGLALGDLQPADAPDSWVVRSQIPDAALSVARGTTVKVFLKKRPKTPKEKKAAAAKAKAEAKAKSAAAAAKPIKIPEIADKPSAEYSTALGKLGLKAKIVPAIGVPKGKVLAVLPKPGAEAKKGDTVTVRAAAGLPPIAVQGRAFVLLLDPVAGKELDRLPPGAGRGFEPSFVPGTDQIVYRSSTTRLVLTSTGSKPAPRTLYDGPDVLEHPSVGPDGQTIAVIRREEGDGDLCFGRLDVADLGHLCLPDDGWDLDGRISWRKDGRVVLVPARRHDNPAVFAIRRYQATKPFALAPEEWQGRTATNTDTPGKGVLAVAYSPGGTRIAAISNLTTDRFEVVLADVNDLELAEPKATGAPGCDVAWRPDGQELAVVESDPGCTQPLGNVVRFSIGAPLKAAPVKTGGSYPSYGPGP